MKDKAIPTMNDKPTTYGQITVSDSWSTVIVLPIEEAALLAQLIAKGRMWERSGSSGDSYASGLAPRDERGKRPSLPAMQVLDQCELDTRLKHGEHVVAQRKLALEEEARKEQAEAAAVNPAAS